MATSMIGLKKKNIYYLDHSKSELDIFMIYAYTFIDGT